MLNLKILFPLVCAAILFSSAAPALTLAPCSKVDPATRATNAFEPFTAMGWYSVAGWAMTYIQLQKWEGADKNKTPVYKGVDTSAAIGAIPVIITMFSGHHSWCRQDDSPEPTRQQGNVALLEEYRKIFYISHALVSASEIAMAASSGVDNRWVIAAAGIATPFIFDLIFRNAFDPHWMSPWDDPKVFVTSSIAPGKDGEWVPMTQVNIPF